MFFLQWQGWCRFPSPSSFVWIAHGMNLQQQTFRCSLQHYIHVKLYRHFPAEGEQALIFFASLRVSFLIWLFDFTEPNAILLPILTARWIDFQQAGSKFWMIGGMWSLPFTAPGNSRLGPLKMFERPMTLGALKKAPWRILVLSRESLFQILSGAVEEIESVGKDLYGDT